MTKKLYEYFMFTKNKKTRFFRDFLFLQENLDRLASYLRKFRARLKVFLKA